MWRVVKGVQKGFKIKCSIHAKPPPAAAEDLLNSACVQTTCDDSKNRQPSWIVGRPYKFHHHWSFGDDYHRCGGDGSQGGDGDGPEAEWDQWMRSFKHDILSCRHPCHILEALGWGTAIVASIQYTKQCHRRTQPTDRGECLMKRFCRYASESIARVQRAIVLRDLTVTVKHVLPQTSRDTTHIIDMKRDIDPSALPQHNEASYNAWSDAEKAAFVKPTKLMDPTDWLHLFKTTTAERLNGEAETVDEGVPSWRDVHNEVIEAWNKMASHLNGMMHNAAGVYRMKSGDVQAAVKHWTAAAGHPKALYNLGLCYEQGIGVDSNLENAAEYYRRAAEQDHAMAAFNLAMMHLRGDVAQDEEQVVALLEKATSLGLKEAQRALGVLYTEGHRRDMVRAAALFGKAAAQKDSEAVYYLGVCYEHGWGVDRNEVKAAELYKQAGVTGHNDAMFNLAVFFENGLGGLPEDKTAALRLYQAIHTDGNTSVIDSIQRLKNQLALANISTAHSKSAVAATTESHSMVTPSGRFSIGSSDSESSDDSTSDWDSSFDLSVVPQQHYGTSNLRQRRISTELRDFKLGALGSFRSKRLIGVSDGCDSEKRFDDDRRSSSNSQIFSLSDFAFNGSFGTAVVPVRSDR